MNNSAIDTRSHQRVLIVDDSQALAQTEAWLLESEGHEVRFCDGVAAVETAREFRPHLILLDIGMPHISGLDVCRLLRADDDLRHVRIIAQTAWGTPTMRQKIVEAGFDDHLIKPVPFEVLKNVVVQSSVPASPSS